MRYTNKRWVWGATRTMKFIICAKSWFKVSRRSSLCSQSKDTQSCTSYLLGITKKSLRILSSLLGIHGSNILRMKKKITIEEMIGIIATADLKFTLTWSGTKPITFKFSNREEFILMTISLKLPFQSLDHPFYNLELIQFTKVQISLLKIFKIDISKRVNSKLGLITKIL